jgi:hypothetical protein
MPADNLTPSQRQSVEAIAGHLERFLEKRASTLRRLNPKLENVWEILSWQQVAKLRNVLSSDKAFGPVRYNVAEILVGDDETRQRALLSMTHQNALLPEIVDAKESDGHRTAGSVEIHDMRTLYTNIDPSLQNSVVLVQTLTWFDFEDAIDLARIDLKLERVAAFDGGGLNDALRQSYRDLTGNRNLTDQDIPLYELRQAKRSLDGFLLRRAGEKAYQAILVREAAANDDPDQLIAAIANWRQHITHISGSGTLDEGMRQGAAKALGIAPADVTPQAAVGLLERMAADAKARLKASLSGASGGRIYNYKDRLASELPARFEAALRGRTLPTAEASRPAPK